MIIRRFKMKSGKLIYSNRVAYCSFTCSYCDNMHTTKPTCKASVTSSGFYAPCNPSVVYN